MSKTLSVSKKQLERYPLYLRYLKELRDEKVKLVSSSYLSKKLNCSEEQVRKDLQLVCQKVGKPRCGRSVEDVINDIETFLGINNCSDAIVVGVGNLGEAFMKFEGFNSAGLNILMGFDNDSTKIGTEVNNKPVFGMNKLKDLIERLNIHIAIITVPKSVAQEITDLLVESGIKAIWNFAPISLNVPNSVIVENVNLTSSLAVLSHKLKQINQF